jgi:hypothetical protein
MARPVKNNAEYFSHDADMRNDVKMKALRKKFGAAGYGVWNMLIEYLTDQDFFTFKVDELTIELMSGDFDAEPDFIKSVIDYCVKLNLLQDEGGSIKCKTLEKRLEVVLLKRKLARDRVSVTETTQSKVKKSKVYKYTIHGEAKGFFITVKAVYITDKPDRIYDLQKYFESKCQLENLKMSGMIRFEDFIKNNPGRQFNDADHLYSSFKKFCIEGSQVKFVPTQNKEDPFSEAAYNQTLWTDEVWKNTYNNQIKNNQEFRTRFNL